MVKQRITFVTDGHLLFPGQTLEGSVEIDGCTDKSIKAIRLQCVGTVHYKSKPKMEVVEILQNLGRPERSEILLHTDKRVWDVARGDVKGDADRRSFSFAVPIEKTNGGLDLPSSFSNRYVTIVYFVSVTIERKWRKDVTKCMAFPVACWNEAANPLLKVPQLQSRGIDVVLLGLVNKGSIDARVSVPRQSYCKGETIPIRMDINHMGDVKQITGVSVNLLRAVKWRRMLKGKEGKDEKEGKDGQEGTEGMEGKEGAEPTSETPAEDGDSAPIRYKGLKVKQIGMHFKPLDIKPGQEGVGITVDYFLDPNFQPVKKKKAASATPPPPIVGPPSQHYSDEFPWSSRPETDVLVEISYELQVRLEIGSSENRGSSAIKDSESRRAVASVPVNDASEESPQAPTSLISGTSFLDGALTGGTKLLLFTFPITICTVADREDVALPELESKWPGDPDKGALLKEVHGSSASPSAPLPPLDLVNLRPQLQEVTPSAPPASPSLLRAHAGDIPSPMTFSYPAQSDSVSLNQHSARVSPTPSLMRAATDPLPAAVASPTQEPARPHLPTTPAASFPPALPPRRVAAGGHPDEVSVEQAHENPSDYVALAAENNSLTGGFDDLPPPYAF